MKKKLLSLVLVAAMVMGLSMTAMAATYTNENFKTDSVTETGDVKISVVEGDVVYKVDVEWDPLDFTYSFGTWQPESHTYNDGDTAWSNGGTANITVTNHSNATVNVTSNYEASANQIDGVSVVFTPATKLLANAALTAYGTENVDKADSVVATVKVEGTPTSKAEVVAQVVGTITVTISK